MLNNRLTRWLATRLVTRVVERVFDREPDLVLRRDGGIYLNRWWLIPRNSLFNVYLHEFLGSDDERALHDHPYVSISLCLSGRLRERYLRRGVETEHKIHPGAVVFRGAKYTHRMVVDLPGLTLFLTGPRVRVWGFHCERGWVGHEEFTDKKGCE